MKEDPKTIIVTGNKASGKTTCLLTASHWFRESKVPYVGLISIGFFSGSMRTHYDVHLLPDGTGIRLCQRDFQPGWIGGGGFWFNPDAIRLGIEHINTNVRNTAFIILDEIGRLELEGKIWAPLMNDIHQYQGHKLLAVRSDFVNEVCNKWGLKNCQIFDTTQQTLQELNDLLRILLLK